MDNDAVKDIATDLLLINGKKNEGHFFHGESMRPLFHEGDFILIREIQNISTLRLGTIIVFKDEWKYPIRRIMERLPNAYLVIGDHWIDRPRIVPFNHILGVAAARIRKKHQISNRHAIWWVRKCSTLIRYWTPRYKRLFRFMIAKAKEVIKKTVV